MHRFVLVVVLPGVTRSVCSATFISIAITADVHDQ